MANRLFCGCCGCDIFAFDDIFDAEDGFTIIDGYRVANKSLPAGGLWALWWSPSFSGDPSIDDQDISFRLLDDSGTVVASWTIASWYEETMPPPGTFTDGIRSDSFSIDWFGTEISDVSKGFVNYPSTEDQKPLRKNGIVCRQSCSSWIFSSYPFGETIGNGEVLRDSLEDYKGFWIFENTQTVVEPFDPETNGKLVRFIRGFPLANQSADFSQMGRLRIGVKASADVFTLGLFAGRIYQEPIESSDCYGYYHGGTTKDEKNKDCVNPVICPVTYPHYTTPLFEVESISGDVTFEPTELSFRADGCSASIEHAVPAVPSGVVSSFFAPQWDHLYTEFSGVGSDWPFPFGLTASATGEGVGGFANSPFVWTYGSGERSNSNLTNFTPGSTLNMRSGNFPFFISYEIHATDDLCVWRISVTFELFCWHKTTSSTSRDVWVKMFSEDGQIVQSANVADRIVLENPLMATATPSGTFFATLPNYSNWPAIFERKRVFYEKDVSSWTGSPPSIAITAADALEVPAAFEILTTVEAGEIFRNPQSGRVRGNVTPSYIPFDFANLTLTLGPRVGFKVPHP